MKMDLDLEELSAAVNGDVFQSQQQAFYLKYCDMFEDSDESTLENTRIHKEYEEESEAALISIVGAPLIERVCEGMEEFVSKGRDMGEKPSATIEATLAVLESMTDYMAFKQTMLLKKRQREAPPSPNKVLKGKDINIMDFESAVNDILELRSAEGEWKHTGDMTFPNGHVMQMDTRPVPNSKKTACRYIYQMNMPYEQFRVAMSAHEPEKEWKVGEKLPEQHLSDVVKNMTIVKVLDNKDLVFKLSMELPWLARWMTGIPKELYILERVVYNPDEVMFVQTPYDYEKGVALEKLGMMGFKQFHMGPDPEEPTKSRITVFETHNLGLFSSTTVLMHMNVWPIDTVEKYKKTKDFKERFGGK